MTTPSTPDMTTEAGGFRVWTTAYGLYNAGSLVGFWTPADEAPETVEEFTAGLRSRGIAFDPRDVGEELHCFDVENAPEGVGEISPTLARQIAATLDELDNEPERAAFAAYVANDSTHTYSAETVEEFRDAYRGTFDTLENWAHEYLEDSGTFATMPEELRPYLDVDAWARDAEMGGDVMSLDVPEGVAVFWC